MEPKKGMAWNYGAWLLAACMILTANLPAYAAGLQGSAGNTLIRNKVKVDYTDAGGTAYTAFSNLVEISVTTINVTPTIRTITPSPGATSGSGTTQDYAVEIVSNANGPGAITLTGTDGSLSANLAAGAVPAVTVPVSSTVLGSTIIDPKDPAIIAGLPITVNAGNPVTFTIPNDNCAPTDSALTGGACSNSNVNSLGVLDTVYLYDGINYIGKFTVTGVADNPPGVVAAGTYPATTAAVSSITLRNDSGGNLTFTPLLSWMIVEAKNWTVRVTQGAFSGGTTSGSWVTSLSATFSKDGGVTNSAAGTNNVTTTASVASLAVAKYVRNVTVAVAGVTLYTPLIPINGATNNFYQSGVSGKPGDIMEYLFVITNNSASATAKTVKATDAVPTYTKLQTPYAGPGFAIAKRSGVPATDVSLVTGGGVCTPAVACGNSGGATIAGSTMTFYLGNGSAAGAGGDIAPLEYAYVIYQVKID